MTDGDCGKLENNCRTNEGGCYSALYEYQTTRPDFLVFHENQKMDIFFSMSNLQVSKYYKQIHIERKTPREGNKLLPVGWMQSVPSFISLHINSSFNSL